MRVGNVDVGELLSTREAAARLRRSEQWVRNAARDGDLPAIVEPLRGGRTRFRFTPEDIQRYIDMNRLGMDAPLAERRPDVAHHITQPDRRSREADAAPAPPVGADPLWIEHYREELTQARMRIADLERQVDDLILTADRKDDEVRRLSAVIRTLLPDS